MTWFQSYLVLAAILFRTVCGVRQFVKHAVLEKEGQWRGQWRGSSSWVEIGEPDKVDLLPEIGVPSKEPYNLTTGTNRSSYSQWNQDRLLWPLLSQIENGFFVESGAFDGEDMSNTLLYEQLGWSGLLVEPTPSIFQTLMTKHRRAYSFQGCLSPRPTATVLKFSDSRLNGWGHIAEGSGFTVVAQPLTALMDQIGQKTVDFWSLDIEGSEAAVLAATDFKKIEVGVLLIEMNKDEQNNKEIQDVMNKEGFKRIGHSKYFTEVEHKAGILDHIFINPKYFQKRNLPVPTPETLAPEYRD